MKVLGISRVGDNEQALMILLSREPTDDEMRDIHDAIKGEGCARHAGQKHGAEAEELRRGIEDILRNTDPKYLRTELQRLLDETDARDSLAYLEARDLKLAAMTAARDEACDLVDALLVGKVGSQPHAMREQARALRKVGAK